VFIEYFQREMQTPPGGLAELARLEWQRLTTMTALRAFVQTAREKMFTQTSDRDDESTDPLDLRPRPAVRQEPPS
jgi:hypothetical protein